MFYKSGIHWAMVSSVMVYKGKAQVPGENNGHLQSESTNFLIHSLHTAAKEQDSSF